MEIQVTNNSLKLLIDHFSIFFLSSHPNSDHIMISVLIVALKFFHIYSEYICLHVYVCVCIYNGHIHIYMHKCVYNDSYNQFSQYIIFHLQLIDMQVADNFLYERNSHNEYPCILYRQCLSPIAAQSLPSWVPGKNILNYNGLAPALYVNYFL